MKEQDLTRNHDRQEVMFLPGMLCDASSWLHQIESLRDIANTTVAEYPYLDSISSMAESVLKTAPPKFIVVGHSMGGRVAFELISRAPDRILGFAILGSDYRGHASIASKQSEIDAHALELALANKLGFSTYAYQWALRILPKHEANNMPLVSKVAKMAIALGMKSLDAHGRAGISRPDYRDVLPKIRCPALILSGSEDLIRPTSLQRDIANQIKLGVAKEVEGAGHMMTLEAPHVVSEILKKWIIGIPQH